MHGHSYYVIGVGRSPDKSVKKINLKHALELDRKGLLHRHFQLPPMKDTVAVPNNGYAVLRFRADNPGSSVTLKRAWGSLTLTFISLLFQDTGSSIAISCSISSLAWIWCCMLEPKQIFPLSLHHSPHAAIIYPRSLIRSIQTFKRTPKNLVNLYDQPFLTLKFRKYPTLVKWYFLKTKTWPKWFQYLYKRSLVFINIKYIRKCVHICF